MELIKLIESLPKKEQQRLEDFSIPVIKARKAYLDFALIQIPKDKAALAEIEKKCAVAAQKADNKKVPPSLEAELAEARAKINGHPKDGWVRDSHEAIRVQLTEEIKKAKAAFASHY